jgi:hypothetical protein
MAKSGRQESPQEFRARMLSIGYMHRTPKTKEKIIVRSDNGADKGKRAKVTTDESGSTITTSDERQDVNIVPKTHIQEIGFM